MGEFQLEQNSSDKEHVQNCDLTFPTVIKGSYLAKNDK